MASEFLKKLQESVDSGTENEAVKAVYNEILDKADKFAADPNAMKEIEEKAKDLSEKAGEEIAKKLTAEEVALLNEVAKKQEAKMLQFEENLKVDSCVVLLNNEIEKLETQIEDYKQTIDVLNDGKVDYSEKHKIIDKIIRDLND